MCQTVPFSGEPISSPTTRFDSIPFKCDNEAPNLNRSDHFYPLYELRNLVRRARMDTAQFDFALPQELNRSAARLSAEIAPGCWWCIWTGGWSMHMCMTCHDIFTKATFW